MPVAGQRDPEHVRSVLTEWIGAQVGASDVSITDLVVPQASGFSNETFLFDASWGGGAPQPMVLRSQPERHALFPEIDLLTQQYLSMKLLGEHTDVPVARVRWAESDPRWLDAPFFVMDRLEGQVPGDNPPYLLEGFVVDMDPATRRQWNTNAVEALAKVGKVDWRAAGFAHLDLAHHGTLGPEQRQGYFRHYLEWATGGSHHPVAHPAFERLVATWPDDGDRIELCWGDARPGNQMFRGTEVVAIFDWEMVSLGNAESDLGWWLFLQRYNTAGVGAQLLDGLFDAAETVAAWERGIGRPAGHVEFYEQLAGFHFVLVMIRLAEALEMPDMAVHNPVADLTCDLLGLPRP